MKLFSHRNGYQPPDAEITVRHDAPDWLRGLIIDFAYEAKFKPSQLRTFLCRAMMQSEDKGNWSEFPNIDGEVRSLVGDLEWYQVYDLIEWLCRQPVKDAYSFVGMDSDGGTASFTDLINTVFRRKGVGWQVVDGTLQVRGPEVFEAFVHQAAALADESGRTVARKELHEALIDLSRRPTPEITGAIQHSMAALECIAKDVTGTTGVTLGEWVKKYPAAFPQPIGAAVEKLWGYASQYGRHVQENKPADYDEAEFVVGLSGALSVYLLRKAMTP